MCPRRKGADRDLCIALWFIAFLMAAWIGTALYMMSWFSGEFPPVGY